MQVTINPIPGVSIEYTYCKSEAAEAAAVAAYNVALSILSMVEAFFNASIEAGRSTRNQFNQAVGSSKTAAVETIQSLDYVVSSTLTVTKIQHVNVRECLRIRTARAVWKRVNAIAGVMTQAIVQTLQTIEPITLFLTTTD